MNPARHLGRSALAVTLMFSLAIVTVGCSSDGSDGGSSTTGAPRPVEVDEVLQSLADDVIVPSYEALGAALADLDAAVTTLCATPSQEALDAARAAWLPAIQAWHTTRPTGVGPALDARLMSDIAFAARPRVVEVLLEGSDPVDPESLSEEGAAGRGLYAAEVLLFGEGSDDLATNTGARRCEYLASTVTLAQDAATPVIEAWTDGDAAADFVAGGQESVAALVNESSERAEEIDAMALRDLAAADSLDDLDETRLGGAADQRLAERKALLAGISAAVGDGSTGISALVGAKDADLADRLVQGQEDATAALDALPDSVADAFEDQDAVTKASEAVAAQKVLLGTEVASQLGVTISFSDSDGDS